MAFILLFKSHFTVLVNYLLVQWTQLDEYCTLGSNYRLMIICDMLMFVGVMNFGQVQKNKVRRCKNFTVKF